MIQGTAEPNLIELKAGRADLRAIGHILSYVGTVTAEPGRDIRGILVAGEFDPPCGDGLAGRAQSRAQDVGWRTAVA